MFQRVENLKLFSVAALLVLLAVLQLQISSTDATFYRRYFYPWGSGYMLGPYGMYGGGMYGMYPYYRMWGYPYMMGGYGGYGMGYGGFYG